jgi:hypothetical protein
LQQIQQPQSDSRTAASASSIEPLVGSGTYSTLSPAATHGGGDSKPEAVATGKGKVPVSGSHAAGVVPAAVTGLVAAPAPKSQTPTATTARQGGSRISSGGRELRRARIVVTVRRTESYTRWLEENPLQAIIASEVDEDTLDAAMEEPPPPPT